MQNSSDPIGNQTYDLLACSTVPQPTVLPYTLLVYLLSLCLEAFWKLQALC